MATALGLQPGRYDLVVPQRATLLERITLPVDLTGCTVLAQVWNTARTTKLLDLATLAADPETGNAVSATAGELILTATPTNTATVAAQGVWDLRVRYPDNTVDYWLEGIAYLNEGATREAA